ncbi:MAG: cation transporter [Gammaproteobacteria bacterium]|nr:cation transporter [Gammaproteobacteria bacterium]MDE2261999.1 cation transporter [Gammaproteobacteria bacterium]
MPHSHEHHGDHHADHDAHPGHEHGHGHGAHGHGRDAGERRLLIALVILGSFTVVEAVGGYLANSIALLAEAAHMLADSASLVLALVAIRWGRRPADERRTYGHRRYQPLAAFMNGQALLLLTIGVVYEASRRLMHLPHVDGRWMLAIALVGGLANLAALVALSGARSLNERGARAHVLSDLVGSGAASVAALLILIKGWTVVDPLLSLLVSALILRSAWALIRESADVLLQTVPPGFDVKHIEAELIGHVPGLLEVHHIHVWSMTGERPTITLHACVAPGARGYGVPKLIHERLRERLHVEDTTVQIEEPDSCETPACGPAH